MRLLACWDCGFKSCRGGGQGCLSAVKDMCCQVQVSEKGRSLAQRSPTDRVCACVLSLSVIIWKKNHPLHLEWVCGRGQTKKELYAVAFTSILQYSSFCIFTLSLAERRADKTWKLSRKMALFSPPPPPPPEMSHTHTHTHTSFFLASFSFSLRLNWIKHYKNR